jgi:sulfur carrier protein
MELSLKITVNGEERQTEARTLDELCRELGFGEARVATARNGEFVPASARSSAALANGDKVEVLSPRQGG